MDNLSSILERGGLGCTRYLVQRDVRHHGIAEPEIQSRRARTIVPCGPPGRTLHDYVPFFFTVQPPMLYRVKSGRVPGYTQGQTPLVYLVTTAQRVRDAGRTFVFTDGHSIVKFTSFFNDLALLDRVDWQVINAPVWEDSVEDPDRRRRRQAEFLVHRACPWELITEIGVMSRTMQARVEAQIQAAGHKPAVIVRRGWYY